MYNKIANNDYLRKSDIIKNANFYKNNVNESKMNINNIIKKGTIKKNSINNIILNNISKNNIIYIVLLSAFIMMMSTPDILINATDAGIRLWGLKVIPGLIMGLMFTSCFKYYMPESSVFGKVMIILSSLLCGFPTGALNCVQYHERLCKNSSGFKLSDISCSNSYIMHIMPYCNISSPGFTINYIYYNLLHDYMDIRVFLICAYSPVIILITYEYLCTYINNHNNIECQSKYINNESNIDSIISKQYKHIKNNRLSRNFKYDNITKSQESNKKTADLSFPDILNQAVSDNIIVILKLGGYIVIFSCICAYIEYIINGCPMVTMLLCGISEITNGMYYASVMDMDRTLKILIILSINAWGGISTLMQTSAIIKDNTKCKLDIKHYIICKLKLTLCTVFVTYLFVNK